MAQKNLWGKTVVAKPSFKDPKDNPENCPMCGHKLEYAWMVHGFNGKDHPEFRCPACNHYFTNPFLDADGKLMPEHYDYFTEKIALENTSKEAQEAKPE